MSEPIELRPALPQRYRVGRLGTPDPPVSQLYVLDVVHDMAARVALAGLVEAYRRLGANVAADELEDLLAGSQEAFAAAVRSRVPTSSSRSKGVRARRFAGA